MTDRQFWLVHMGRPGGKLREGSIDFTRQLLDRGYVAIGWPNMGDLAKLPDDREAFRERFQETHPGYHSERGMDEATGMLHRFAYGVRPGDLVVCPTPGGGNPVHIGEFEGDCLYEQGTYGDYHHLRKVRWLATVPRNELTSGAKDTLTVNRSLMRIHKHASEFGKYL
jgi:restriction system protein